LTTGASNESYQAETILILNEKYEHHIKIYKDGSKNEEEKVGYALMVKGSKIRKRKFPQKSIYSVEQSTIINAIYSTQHNDRSLQQKKIQKSKNPINSKTVRPRIHKSHTTKGSQLLVDPRKRKSRQFSQRSIKI
jgi:hypothetical protein